MCNDLARDTAFAPVLGYRNAILYQQLGTATVPSDDVSPDGRFRLTPEPSIFRHLVGLKIEHGANRIDSVVPLRLTLTADSHLLEIIPPIGNAFQQFCARFRKKPSAPLKLLIRLRSVYVRYSLKDCAIPESSRSARLVAEGKYAASENIQTKTVATSNMSGKASGSLGAALSSPSAQGAVSGAASAHHDTNHARTSKVTQSIEVASVLPVPDGWRIGDPAMGDPTKRDGCLAGQYLADPGDRDTCSLVLTAANAEARFEVTVRDTGILVTRSDRSVASPNEQDAALATMRNRLAAIALEKALPRLQGDGSGEHLLAAVTCTLERASDLPELALLPPSPPAPKLAATRRRNK